MVRRAPFASKNLEKRKRTASGSQLTNTVRWRAHRMLGDGREDPRPLQSMGTLKLMDGALLMKTRFW